MENKYELGYSETMLECLKIREIGRKLMSLSKPMGAEASVKNAPSEWIATLFTAR